MCVLSLLSRIRRRRGKGSKSVCCCCFVVSRPPVCKSGEGETRQANEISRMEIGEGREQRRERGEGMRYPDESSTLPFLKAAAAADVAASPERERAS